MNTCWGIEDGTAVEPQPLPEKWMGNYAEHLAIYAAFPGDCEANKCWYDRAWLESRMLAINDEMLKISDAEYKAYEAQLQVGAHGNNSSVVKEALKVKKKQLKNKVKESVEFWTKRPRSLCRELEMGLCGLHPDGRANGSGGGGFRP